MTAIKALLELKRPPLPAPVVPSDQLYRVAWNTRADIAAKEHADHLAAIMTAMEKEGLSDEAQSHWDKCIDWLYRNGFMK